MHLTIAPLWRQGIITEQTPQKSPGHACVCVSISCLKASSMWWFGGSVVASAFEPVGVQSDRDAPLARLVTHSSAHPKASSIISSTFYFSVQNAANEPCHGTTAYDAPGICMGDA
ncbi:uncharacterized protein BDCG_08822 [Blastomyces dermatitidis ER-3]|uniref:Uncharacterized protein n=1 Tax=Ajellomyces dermatitidis (strain ER-3 / ATCC MYA-2586) TaxID=559297 RepID=A0ABP2EPT0_AJEDR|nr:uncharacterized protein BDCG_08822 [Blastomyces dermatitidis ER-3]EEQ85553.2 hypothetical protein BDCG_08822 [Blastomyces dermatitidis ER-3]